MANPALDAVLGTSGSSGTTPAPPAPTGGGNAALNAVLGTGSAAPAAAAPHKGGGFLGTLSRIPGDFASHAIPDIEGAVIGTGRLVKNIVAPGTHPSFGQLFHEYTHPQDWFSHQAIAADPLATQLTGIAKSIPATIEHPLRDPFSTALLLYPAAVGAARLGIATKAGLGGETAAMAAAKPLGKITARTAEGGTPVVVRELPRDPYIAARMKVVDKALKTITKVRPFSGPRTPVIGEFARSARAVDRAAKLPLLKAQAAPALAKYQRALAKLGTPERVALGALARVPLTVDLEGWRQILAGQHTEVADRLVAVLSDPKVVERYTDFTKFPRLVAAHEAARNLVAEAEKIGARTGALTPETAAASPFYATRVARGAEFVNPTSARLGRLSPIHVAHAKYVAGLEKRHEAALLDARRNAAVAILGLKGRLTVAQKDAAVAHLEGTGAAEGVPGLIGNKIVSAVEGPPKVTTSTVEVPRTPEEAAARLAELERLHNAQLDEMARSQLGEISRNAEAGRSKQNRITQLAQMGYTAIGRRELRDREKMDAQRAKVAALGKKGESKALAAARAKLAKMEADHDALYRGKNLRTKHGAIGNYGRRKILPTVAEERRAAQQAQIDAVLAHPTAEAVKARVPQVAAIAARMEEMDRLHRALGEHNLPEFAREPTHPEGALFHGSPEGALGNIDALYHTKEWREGPGFYATTSAEKAAKYAEGRTASAERRAGGSGVVNVVKLKPGAKVLDLDAAPESTWLKMASDLTGSAVTPELWRQWARDITAKDAKGASEGVLNRLRMMHLLTGWAELPKTDAFYAIEEWLAKEGYQATKHMEGGVPVYVIKDENAIERLGTHTPAPPAEFGTRTETTTVTRPGAPGVGRLITPLGGSRAERLGSALSVARDRLEQMDAAAARRIQPTGLVGGGTPEQIAAEISRSTGLSPGAYEREVVHVTTPTGAAGIRSGGFKLRAKGGLGGDDYGPAVYLADRASDMGAFWRNQLETKNESGAVATEALQGAVSLAKPFEVDYNRYNLRDDVVGRLSPRDVLEAQRPDLLQAFDKARAGGASERRALGDAAREGGYDGLVVHLPQGDEIVAFDPGRVAFEGAGGRPQPFKLPDRSLDQAELNRGAGGLGSGLAVPLSPLKTYHGALMRTGYIDLVHDRLTGHYLQLARFESKLLKHRLVRDSAQPVPKGEGLPAGMEWVRSVKGEKMPHLETIHGEHLAELDRVFGKEGEAPFTISAAEAQQALEGGNDLIARNDAGERLAVSREFADRVGHQFSQENRMLKNFVQRPLDVWRALVLNLRVPWLVNNIVGNNLLYALRFAGNGGMKAYLNMLLDMRGPVAVRRLLGSDVTRRTLSQADLAEVTPEALRGTFIGTQLPTGAVAKTRPGRVAVKSARVLNAGLAPLDRRTEAFLRRGAVNALLRNSPEAKALYRAMPKQERSWQAAMKQAAQQHSDLRDLTVREVNDALGDYLSLNHAERGVVRRAIPFYGWYREITRIAAHTALNHPLRVLILSRLGQMESDRQESIRGPFPSFLQGSLALGPGPNGTENIAALRSANPLSSVVDLARAASIVAHPTNRTAAQAALGILNPFAEGAGATLFGAQTGSPQSPAYQGGAAAWLAQHGGLPGTIAGQVFGGLPQVQAFTPPKPSRLYPNRSRASIIEAMLGSVLRQPSLQQAHYYHSQGR